MTHLDLVSIALVVAGAAVALKSLNQQPAEQEVLIPIPVKDHRR